MESRAIKGILDVVAASYIDSKTKAQPSPNVFFVEVVDYSPGGLWSF